MVAGHLVANIVVGFNVFVVEVVHEHLFVLLLVSELLLLFCGSVLEVIAVHDHLKQAFIVVNRRGGANFIVIRGDRHQIHLNMLLLRVYGGL